jgi:WD40 repeat protein
VDDTWDLCIRTMDGHTGCVTSVVFSPDGTRIVSGSWDNTVRLWDAVSGAHLNTLEGHTDNVVSVAFSPDGTHLVSGSWDNTVRLWDAINGVHLNTLRGHTCPVTSVAFSPDGTRLVSGSRDYTVRLWDAVSGVHLDTLKSYSVNPHSLALSINSPHTLFSHCATALTFCATAPISSYFILDGWIYSSPLQQRLCWIPISCRGRALSTKGTRAAIGTDSGRVIILDFTGMDSYFGVL